MFLFFIAASLLVVGALALIIPNALRGSNQNQLDQLETNIGIAKDRRAQLEQSLSEGMLDQETYDSEIHDLENALAQDISAAETERKTSKGGLGISAAIALFLPIASGALYLKLGNPDAVDTQAMHASAVAAQSQRPDTPPALEELLPNLEQKLLANPGDINGWKLLGKSYLSISDFSNAKRTLLKAYELDDQDPDLLSQLAEATAMERGGDLSGQASEYLDSALAINPDHQQSLWLVAIAKQQAGEHEEAITRFETLRTQVEANPSAVASVNEMINVSKQELGMPVTPSAPVAPIASGGTSEESEQQSTAKVIVTVDLGEGVAEKVEASDSVFIFATASSGPPMPLAVSRHLVSELPVTVELNDAMAMMPAMTLSQFPSVTIGARVSKSGNAIAQAGDWSGEVLNIEPATAPEVQVQIDTLEK